MKNARTRLFLVVAVGILVLGLGTGLLASYMGGFENLALLAGDGPDELAYVPSEATMVAYADVRDIAQSDLRQKLRELQPAGGQQTFQEETGIDIDNDVDHVVAAAWDTAADPKHGPPLVLARGRFDDDLIETKIRQHGGDVRDIEGKRVLIVEKGDVAVSFLEPGLAAFGSLEAVRAAIRTKAAGKSIRDNGEVMALVRDVDEGNAWAVAHFDAMRVPHLPREVATQLPPISWFAFSGRITDGVSGTLHAQTRDDAAAQDLREVIRGFMALARLQAGQKAEFADLVNSLELGGTGKDVTLRFDVPAKTIETFTAIAAARRHEKSAPDGL